MAQDHKYWAPNKQRTHYFVVFDLWEQLEMKKYPSDINCKRRSVSDIYPAKDFSFLKPPCYQYTVIFSKGTEILIVFKKKKTLYFTIKEVKKNSAHLQVQTLPKYACAAMIFTNAASWLFYICCENALPFAINAFIFCYRNRALFTGVIVTFVEKIFSSISFFNSIPNFMGYLMPKSSL